MPIRPMFVLGLLVIAAAGLAGCTSSGFGFGKSTPFAKNEQWEPEVEEGKKSDWSSEPSKLRTGKNRASNEDPIDKLIWSSEARDISRNLGGSL